MSDSPARGELWRRLAQAQDAVLADRRPLHDVQIRTVRRRLAPALALASGVLVAGVAVLLLHTPPLRFQVAGEKGSPGQPLVAEAESELPLRFSDGSSVTFQPGSAGVVQRLTGAGAEVVVERGRLDAAVVHADRTLWVVRAGPFRVRVTGTRFSLSWSPASGTLALSLHEGSVLVDGGLLSAGVPLRAGQRLAVEVATGRVRTEPLDQPLAPVPPPPPEPVKRAEAKVSRPEKDWRALAERGAHREALAAAERLGFVALCRRLDARQALALGDVARYAGAPARARLAFEALVARFPDDPLAADAVFSLGRLAFEEQHPAEAARWFERYVVRWPNGPLAEQAAGRVMEAARRAGDRDGARAAARAYLDRAPHGPQAALARELLEREEAR